MAHDGDEAVAIAERLRPHVILMDVGLLRLNGLDATPFAAPPRRPSRPNVAICANWAIWQNLVLR